MPTFTAQKIVSQTPALSVVVENATVTDASGFVIQPLTYTEVQNTLGQQNLLVDGFYLYSENQNQLSNVIQYNNRNATGSQDIKNVVTQIDPFQVVPSLLVDLKNTGFDLVLDGNSNIGTSILPNSSLELKLLTKRIGNSFGGNYQNFKMIENDTRTNFFKNTYGASMTSIQKTNLEIEKSFYEGVPLTEESHTSSLLTSGIEGRPLVMQNGDVIYVQEGQPEWYTEEEKYLLRGISARQKDDLELVDNTIGSKKYQIKGFEPNHNQLPLFLLGIAAISYIMYKNIKK
jgi:hypothetical protein